MRCGLISPYPPDKCGIAIYARKLVDELSKIINVSIFANEVDGAGSTAHAREGGVKVSRCWRRDTFTYPFNIFKAILQERPDLIHVQHEFLAYGVRKYSILFPLLLLLIKMLSKPTVVTMHSVVPLEELNEGFFMKHGVGGKFVLLKKIAVIFTVKLITLLSNAITVHSKLARDYLIHKYGIKKTKVFIIPHGVDSPLDEVAAKGEDRSPHQETVLFFGFITPGKGVEVLLKAFSELPKALPNSKLLILGSYHPRLYKEDPAFIGSIEEKIRELNLESKVLFENRFVSDQELQSCVQTADVIVFPYVDGSIIGASGALSSCITFGKPVIATDIPRFNGELENGVNSVLIKPNDEEALREALLKLLLNKRLRMKLGSNMKTLSYNRSWRHIAMQLVKVYEKL
ncbi:MAG: glycosyltransferase [Candidatus Bathyarchaeia archaeon]